MDNTKKKILYFFVKIIVIVFCVYGIYSLMHIGDHEPEKTAVVQSIDWHYFDYQSDEEMEADADLVIIGEVLATSSYNIDTGYGSLVEISIETVLKGDAGLNRIAVFQYGNAKVAPPAEFPLMRTGEKYKLYLQQNDSYYLVVGGYLGAERIS